MAANNPDVVVRRIDAADDGELAATDTVYRKAELAVLPDASLHSYAELVTALRRPSPEQFMLGFVAVTAQSAPTAHSVVGLGVVSGRLLDHTDEAGVSVWVPPERSGAGIGRALADVCESAVEHHEFGAGPVGEDRCHVEAVSQAGAGSCGADGD